MHLKIKKFARVIWGKWKLKQKKTNRRSPRSRSIITSCAATRKEQSGDTPNQNISKYFETILRNRRNWFHFQSLSSSFLGCLWGQIWKYRGICRLCNAPVQCWSSFNPKLQWYAAIQDTVSQPRILLNMPLVEHCTNSPSSSPWRWEDTLFICVGHTAQRVKWSLHSAQCTLPHSQSSHTVQ